METKFTFKQDREQDGCMIYENAKTLNTYHAINRELQNVDLPKRFNIFCAFSNEQYEQGLKSIRPLKDGEKVLRFGSGMFGTREGIDAYFAFIEESHRRIKEECDPQEVYCYEFNNYESMIAYDGDLNAIRLVIDIWGKEAAKNVKRKCAFYSLESLLNEEE